MKRLKTSHFFGMILLFVTLFYLLRTWYYYEATRTDVQRIVYQNIRNILLEAQDRIKEELSRDNPHYSIIRNLITRVENSNDVVSKLSFIQEGAVIFSSEPRDIGKPFSPEHYLSILDVSPEMILNTPLLSIKDVYYHQGERHLFYVTAQLSDVFIQRLFYDKMKHFFFFSGLIPVLLVIIIWWILRRMVIRPLENLEHMIRKHDIDYHTHAQLKEINDLGYTLKGSFIQLQEQINALDHMARYDLLTDLPNRHFMQEYIDQMIEDAYRENGTFSLLYLDLDQFKQINDTDGHDVGDKILHTIGSRLNLLLSEHEIVGRIGGDEFLYCTPHIDDAYLSQLIHLIKEAILTPFSYGEKTYHLSVSIGIAKFPKDGENRIELIKHADIALYEAKRTGRNCYVFFDPSLLQVLMKESQLKEEMKRALHHGDFVLYYQPEVEIQSGLIIGLEALLRWKHPQYGIIPPDDFIPLSEKSGFILPLGSFVLEEAIRTIYDFQLRKQPVQISVNLSILQISSELITEIAYYTEQYPIDPKLLHLEITESILMENFEEYVTVLSSLQEAGYQISLDDFGTGYSSLKYLQTLPVNTLKIDKSFIQQVDTEENSRALVKGIIALGHALKLKVIAEGVETEEILSFLQHHHCDSYQGYLFSPPLPLERLLEDYFPSFD